MVKTYIYEVRKLRHRILSFFTNIQVFCTCFLQIVNTLHSVNPSSFTFKIESPNIIKDLKNDYIHKSFVTSRDKMEIFR